MATYKSARECIGTIMRRYAALTSYVDIGVVHTIGKTDSVSCSFETQFSAPGKFRFQFTRPHPYPPLRHITTTHTIGSDGVTSYFARIVKDGRPEVEIEESLEYAVAGATGISEGSVYTIGALLLRGTGGFSLAMLRRPRFKPSRTIDSTMCHRISGFHPRGGRFTIWFGAEDLLIRKVVRHKFRSEERRSMIRVGEKIEDVVFDVPGAKPNTMLDADATRRSA